MEQHGEEPFIPIGFPPPVQIFLKQIRFILPVMDGLAATRSIRDLESAAEPSTPIVALSGDAISERRDECMRAGCTDVHEKPIRRERVLELIQTHALPSDAR